LSERVIFMPKGERYATAVLDVRPILRASSKAMVEARLRRWQGVRDVEANPGVPDRERHP
jgi:hypothetical protein